VLTLPDLYNDEAFNTFLRLNQEKLLVGKYELNELWQQVDLARIGKTRKVLDGTKDAVLISDIIIAENFRKVA